MRSGDEKLNRLLGWPSSPRLDPDGLDERSIRRGTLKIAVNTSTIWLLDWECGGHVRLGKCPFWVPTEAKEKEWGD